MEKWKKLKRENLENSVSVQKQPPKMIFKKSFSQKLYNIQRKVVPTKVFSCKYCEIFKNNYFEQHQRKATSNCRLQQQ